MKQSLSLFFVSLIMTSYASTVFSSELKVGDPILVLDSVPPAGMYFVTKDEVVRAGPELVVAARAGTVHRRNTRLYKHVETYRHRTFMDQMLSREGRLFKIGDPISLCAGRATWMVGCIESTIADITEDGLIQMIDTVVYLPADKFE